MSPLIIVAINGGKAFYSNQFEGKCQVHDFFIQEFVPHIDATYRTLPDRQYRHTMGFSMGGYGATMFVVKHPNLFSAFTDMGGALQGPRHNYFQEMHGGDAERLKPFDIWLLIEQNRESLNDVSKAIWIGSEDICRQVNVSFHELLTGMGMEHQYNDWNARPLLEGVEHNLARYFDLYGEEIWNFHDALFNKARAEISPESKAVE